MGTFGWDAGGVGSWGRSIGVRYESTNNLCNGFSEGTVEDVDGGGGGHCAWTKGWDSHWDIARTRLQVREWT
jgi:hypothetical protein